MSDIGAFLENNEISDYECDMENPFAFFSYAHVDEDSKIAREVFLRLYRLGYNLWFDMANIPHDRHSWKQAADNALLHDGGTCKLIFFFRSENSLVKPNVLRELSTFVNFAGEHSRIVAIDIRQRVDISDFDEIYDGFLNSLDGEDKECCSKIFNLVSTSCSAIRFHEDAEDNIDRLVNLMMNECARHNILQHFKVHEKMNEILAGNFSIKLKPDQEQVFNVFTQLAANANPDDDKSVILVKGKPGTGKTALAIKMLMHALSLGLTVNYVTKSAAIRNAYTMNLDMNAARDARFIFKGSGAYVDAPANSVDIIIVDEAQLLGHKSGMFENMGENQTAEIINTGIITVFLLDDNQKISLNNYGSSKEIEEQVRKIDPYGDNYYPFELLTQVRCRGADSYIELVDSILEMKEDSFGRVVKTSPYSIIPCDSAMDLHDFIRWHSSEGDCSKLLAGYCWNWIKEGRDSELVKDIVIDDFEISWNTRQSIESMDSLKNDQSDTALPVYMAQGLEFDYVGVIIGPDLKYQDGHVRVDVSAHAKTDHSLKGYVSAMKSDDEKVRNEMIKRAESIIKGIYRVLLTRGTKGCYVYCVDEELNKYFRKRILSYEKSALLSNNRI